jgi:hypothetical protein
MRPITSDCHHEPAAQASAEAVSTRLASPIESPRVSVSISDACPAGEIVTGSFQPDEPGAALPRRSDQISTPATVSARSVPYRAVMNSARSPYTAGFAIEDPIRTTAAGAQTVPVSGQVVGNA